MAGLRGKALTNPFPVLRSVVAAGARSVGRAAPYYSVFCTFLSLVLCFLVGWVIGQAFHPGWARCL